ncbi:hypothetical protein IFR04_006027 [Cadophora malorum]|uniref:DUF6590 domain-containing protein n=1 Tax=Cadophora malorum TaxID=108018 RepID=A0A8H7TKH6_9HELO|nr:hypothetical protein IFR04_006027 [Cadophora malorum]
MSSRPWDTAYPLPWCAWQWSAENNIYGRAREVAPDEYEWEYSDYIPTDASQPAVLDSTPRNRETDPSPSAIRESDDVVSEITGTFQRTSIGGSRPKDSKSRYGKANDKDTLTTEIPSRSTTPVVQFKIQNETRIVTRRPERDYEKKDPNFRVHSSDHFKFGKVSTLLEKKDVGALTAKVFKVMWSEPVGSGGTAITGAEQKGFQKVRRFVVIDTRNGHSICLPILTYGGKATLKKGAHPEDHAAVYSSSGGATILSKEKMKKKSVKIDVRLPSDKLDPLSRLNYAKVYTVEHNVKVNFIGQVNRHYEQRVVLDYNASHGPIADSPYEMRTSTEEDREHETRNSDGTNPTYQAGQETFLPEGEYSAVGRPSQSGWQQPWNSAGSSSGQIPMSTGFGPVATASYGPLAVSPWGNSAPNAGQDPQQSPDESLYRGD